MAALIAAFLAGAVVGGAGVWLWARRRGIAAGPGIEGPGDDRSGPAGAGPRGGPLAVGESLESAGFRLCEAARKATGVKTALALRDPATGVVTISSVCHDGDRRLMGTRVTPDSAAGRACAGDVPIVGVTSRELFGHLRADRRRKEEEGTAFPVPGERESAGALVVFQRLDRIPEDARQRLADVLEAGGPRLAAAVALRAAEIKALTDELTGLWNRRGLDRAMQGGDQTSCALLLADLDHFKVLNDTHGHAAGDAALRHVATVLRAALRQDDAAARVGGEEFALWLPGASLELGQEVAERVRQAVERTRFEWGSAAISMTCSVGVAAKPEIVREVANLYTAADAALYRAKEGGRNRVAVALASR